MATDFLGHEIMPGDAVVYLTYAGTSAELEQGVVGKCNPHTAIIKLEGPYRTEARRAEYKIVDIDALHRAWEEHHD